MIPYEIRRLQDILASFLGQPKSDVNENYQLQFNCPRCIEHKGENEKGKYNLEVNLRKNVFRCWSCSSDDESMQGSIKKLIKKFGTPAIMAEYNDAIKDIMESRLYELISFKDGLRESTREMLKLPQTYTQIPDINTCPDWRVKKYLLSRGFTQEMIDRYNIGYTTWDEPDWRMRNRIIIPSYDAFGDLNYWVGRDYMPEKKDKKFKKTKYLNCKEDKQTIIFQENQIQWDAPIILVEGAIDCLYYNGNAIALLGKVLTKDSEIYRKLMKNANSDVYICLDSDTKIEETKRIYNALNHGRLRNKIHYIPLSETQYKDFGEVYEAEGPKGIIKVLKKAKDFTEIELVI